MLVGETMRVALEALRANKLRSFLTMLGIVIGVSAVIAMVALGRGAQQSVKDRISALGTTLITVVPGQFRGPGGVASATNRAVLTIDDARDIEQRATYVVAVQPEVSRSFNVQYGNRNTNTNITGTSSNYLEVRRFTLDAGRMFSPAEDAGRRRVAVLGSQVLADLGVSLPEALIGETVRIGSLQFEVVGILQSKAQAGGFGNPDDQVLVPIETARYRLMGTDRLRSISMLAPSEADIPVTMAEVRKILRRSHRLRVGADDDFSIRNQSDFLATLGETTQVFTLLLAGIATVSLLVGGIGIMNIMLVSVTERTREIGLRMAVGARTRDILGQFLVEAVTLSLIGGLAGVALGMGTSFAIAELAGWRIVISPEAIGLAVAFAFVIGVFFGFYPARKAARLNPVEALRFE
ncbi:MAG TPA: ABC transporter permease [Candidatus Eisenbacteria bacterium]|nr:ABC transporter permease [Candidatus Eisenbacteria bacterium]